MRLWMRCILAAVAVNGCTVPDQVQLHNNTGAGLAITACGKTERIGGGLTFITYLCGGVVVIESDRWRWVYSGFPLNWDNGVIAAYGLRTSRGNRLLDLQLESDGSVLLVLPPQQYPAAPDIAQPAGFPIRPTETVPK